VGSFTSDPGPADELLEHLEDGVLLLTLNRLERNNAWTHDLEDRYFDRLVAASADPEVRVIVITGAGKAFCPGLDMEVLARLAAEGKADRPRYPMTLLTQIPKPVICAVNGAAAGIGIIQMCASDVRFAAAGAKLTTAFARRGLPSEHGLTWLLTRLVGTGTAMDLLLSGRVILAEEALGLGLVDRVVPADELLPAALAYAREIAANCSPWSLATIKQQVYEDFDRGQEASRLESLQRMAESRDLPDLTEGVASYRERRPARFAGLSRVVDVERVVPP
jgi:enoyl-CoA hydratase/carnithine racemase